MSEERGFEVRDRRRVRPDGGVTPEDVAEAAGSSQFVSGDNLDELLDSDLLLDDSPEDAADEAMAQIRVSARLALQAGWGCGLGAVAPSLVVRIILSVNLRDLYQEQKLLNKISLLNQKYLERLIIKKRLY